jgi:hypothetical protein
MNLPDSSLITDHASALLALLIAGHVFADFLVQTDAVARRKPHSTPLMLWHGLLTLLTHAVLVWPFWNPAVLGAVILIAVVHTIIDMVRAAIGTRWVDPLQSFLIDQTLHAAVIVLAWWGVLALDGARHGWLELGDAALLAYGSCSVVIAGLVFNGKGGTKTVRTLLERYPEVVPGHAREVGFLAQGDEALQDERDTYAMGRTIGILERLLLYTLVLLGQWSALGFVLAAKSVARFRELESKHFADYYLIGTLTSVLVAIATGIAVRWVVGGW